ncbi:hypothetical protein [Dactylosporangium salmoneum]
MPLTPAVRAVPALLGALRDRALVRAGSATTTAAGRFTAGHHG